MNITFITVAASETIDLNAMGTKLNSLGPGNFHWIIVSDKPSVEYINEETKDCNVARTIIQPPAWGESIGLAGSLLRGVQAADRNDYLVMAQDASEITQAAVKIAS